MGYTNVFFQYTCKATHNPLILIHAALKNDFVVLLGWANDFHATKGFSASHHAMAIVGCSNLSLRKWYRDLEEMGASPPPPLGMPTWGAGITGSVSCDGQRPISIPSTAK
jgi:hypothetical protein